MAVVEGGGGGVLRRGFGGVAREYGLVELCFGW